MDAQPRREPPEDGVPSGVLVIDKPEGCTSMDVCRIVRRRLRSAIAPTGARQAGAAEPDGGAAGAASESTDRSEQRSVARGESTDRSEQRSVARRKIKVGHGGTLDPLATGVLVVLVGRATRLCDRIMAGEKRYIAEVDLSRTSTTDDREGKQREVAVSRPPTREEVEGACRGFVGIIQQRPPAYSAVKVGGRRAYRLARSAEAGPAARSTGELEGDHRRADRGAPMPELPPRPVEIHDIALLKYHWPIARLDIRCGKGTYIRSLARDLGAALGTGGMLHSLRRTAVGPFTIDEAIPLNALPQRLTQADLRSIS